MKIKDENIINVLWKVRYFCIYLINILPNTYPIALFMNRYEYYVYNTCCLSAKYGISGPNPVDIAPWPIKDKQYAMKCHKYALLTNFDNILSN